MSTDALRPGEPGVYAAKAMQLRFTRHALDAIAERRLQRAWVERVAGEPEWSEHSRSRAGVTLLVGRIAEAAGKVLRVVAVDEAGVRVVLSAHFDRKATQAARARDADDL